jgi:hypothetical protein
MITITKDKIYRSPFSLKSTKPDSEAVKEIGLEEALYSLGEDVEFGEDLTFSKIFDFIIFHKEFFNILFSSEMRGLLIDDFIGDYEREVSVIHDTQEYNLRLSWIGDVYEYDDDVDFIDYVSLDAYGKINKEIDEKEYGISIAFASLSEIKENTIFIDNSFEVHDSNTYEDELSAILKASYRPITLYQAILSILREVTFYGKPEERDAQRRELVRHSEEIEKWVEEGTLEENTKSWNEVASEIDEIIEENLQEDDKITFWDVLYPKAEPTGISSQDVVDNVIIALAEGSEISLEEQLQEAHDSEDYEQAAKLKKLIDKRNGNKTD